MGDWYMDSEHRIVGESPFDEKQMFAVELIDMATYADGRMRVEGDTLTITGTNRTLVYHIDVRGIEWWYCTLTSDTAN